MTGLTFMAKKATPNDEKRLRSNRLNKKGAIARCFTLTICLHKRLAANGLSRGGDVMGEQQNESVFSAGSGMPFEESSPASRFEGNLVTPRLSRLYLYREGTNEMPERGTGAPNAVKRFTVSLLEILACDL